MLSAASGEPLSLPDTPDSARKNPLARAVSSLRSSGGKVKSLGRIGSLREKNRISSSSLSYTLQARQNGSVESGDLGHGEVSHQGLQRSALYVLGEKTQMKGVKVDSFPKCDFIPVEFAEVRHVKSSFKKLMRACVPSASFSEEKGLLKAVEESGWFPQLQSIMLIAGATVDLMDAQGSSVMLCLEDGWDFATQVISVAQLLLDPYYRTLEGFRILVEKEWMSFGHRYTHRSNQTAANQASGFAPIFLQFLDVVHQVLDQFPLSFEFNQYFLKFLAFHYVSNRFRTFMLDNEYERVEVGWLLDERPQFKAETSSLDGELDTSPKHSSSQGLSIWDYIDKHHKRSPVFYNYMYSPLEQETVLRPYSNISNLKLWDYYMKEDLAHGPSYDFEAVAREMKMLEEQDMVDGPMTSNTRRIVNACYDNVDQQQPESCTHLLLEIQRLHAELGQLASKWKNNWEKLDHPSREQLIRQMSFNTQMVKSHGRSIHKRSTLEILVRGKLIGEASKMFSQTHRFEKFTYTTPAYCDYCSHVLWGLVKTGMRCSDCGYNSHEKCMPHVPKNCTRLESHSSDVGASSTTISKTSISETASVTGVTPTIGAPSVNSMRRNTQIYDQFCAPVVTEHRTHEGYLYKRGALLKGWKQRWFVLDSMKHQLRYYDTADDSHCKGFIDLAEVVSVQTIKNIQSAPKKADENAAFELKTVRRLYNFLAPDVTTAQEWIDKIQGCIQ